MIKRIIKILLTIFVILFLAILYLTIFGIETDKFNNQIINNTLKINKKINLSLKDVKYLLNPYNFTINIKTKNPQISIGGRSLGIKDIQTNIALKSLINNQFSIDYLKLKTKEIKLDDVIALGRIFKNSPQLFVLNTIIKDGYIIANINLNFDEKGKIKKNYKIEGSVKKARLNILNQIKLNNLNFNFDIVKNVYSLKQIEMKFNETEITSPLIEIQEIKNSFFVNGQFLSNKKDFDIDELRSIFVNLTNQIDIKKIEFSSKNNFSFNINKKLKFDNLKVQSIIELNNFIIAEKNLKLKTYLPNFVEEIKFRKHKININYEKNKFDIKGNGNILLENKIDSLSYQVIRNKNNYSFNTKINLKNNSLLIDFLDYEKKEDLDSLLLIKGNFKKNNQLIFNLINLKENDNEILIEGLNLNKSFKIIDIKKFNINYRNNKKISNNLNLKKDKLDFIIEGQSFDATSIINNIIDSDEESSSIFDNLNSKIKIKIKKIYIDEVNYINNLYGNLEYNNNKISNLKLESVFPNKEKINLSIETKNNSETITRLFSSYPKPLVKRYSFIKGFEEGHLDFFSSKKGNKSNSVLIIDNFKIINN